MRAEIRRIHELIGSATIYVTHDQEEALSLADRIVVMRAGVVRQVGTPEELYAPPGRMPTSRNSWAIATRSVRALPSAGKLSASIGGVDLQGTPIEPRPTATCVAAIRPDDLQVDAGRAARGEGGIGAIPRRRILLLRPHRRRHRALFPLSKQKFKRATPSVSTADPGRVLVYAGTPS